MPRIYDVITIGEATIDAFMTIHDANSKCHLETHTGELCFKHGSKIDVEKYDFQMGGNAANVAVGLTRLGLNAAPACEIGDDEFSIKIRNQMALEGVERMLVTQSKGRQSNFSVIINFKGDRTIFNEDLKRAHKFDFEDMASKYIYLTSMGDEWIGPYEHALAFGKTHGSKIVFNPGTRQLSQKTEIIQNVLKVTDILFVNKEEAELILFNHFNKKVDNSDNYIKDLCQELQKLGPKTIVMTNGKEGSYALTQDGTFLVQGLFPGKAIERTGAGDAYSTGFLAALIYDLSVEEAMKWGAINSAAVVSVIGAEAGLLTKEEIIQRLSK